jgi:hypothetical protein
VEKWKGELQPFALRSHGRRSHAAAIPRSYGRTSKPYSTDLSRFPLGALRRFTLEVFFNFPFIPHRGITGGFQFFNFSTFQRPPPLGLDIQHITRYRPELVRRMFNAADRERLAACTDETARQRLFAQLWCRAEAFAKATGEGLRWPFPTPPPEAHFTDFEVGEDYCGSVCVIEN